MLLVCFMVLVVLVAFGAKVILLPLLLRDVLAWSDDGLLKHHYIFIHAID